MNRRRVILAAVVALLAIPLYAAKPRAVGRPNPAPPEASVKAPVCVPATITSQPVSSPLWIPLYGSSTLSIGVTGSDPVTVSWFTDDGVPAGTGASVSVSPSIHTCYYAVVENGCERKVSSSTWVMIATPQITENATVKPSTITAGQAAVLQAGGGTGQGSLTYKWYTSDGTFIGNGKKLVVHPTVTTSYYYKLCNELESEASNTVTVTVTGGK